MPIINHQSRGTQQKHTRTPTNALLSAPKLKTVTVPPTETPSPPLSPPPPNEPTIGATGNQQVLVSIQARGLGGREQWQRNKARRQLNSNDISATSLRWPEVAPRHRWLLCTCPHSHLHLYVCIYVDVYASMQYIPLLARILVCCSFPSVPWCPPAFVPLLLEL